MQTPPWIAKCGGWQEVGSSNQRLLAFRQHHLLALDQEFKMSSSSLSQIPQISLALERAQGHFNDRKISKDHL